MRLAILGPSHHPVAEPFAGGQERFTADLTRGLRKRGHHVELYALPGSDPTLADHLHVMPRLPPLSEIASADPNMPEELFLHDQFVYLAAVRDLLARNDFDAILNESLHQLPLALSPVFGVPVITTLHTPPFPWMEIGAWLAGTSGQFVAVSAAMQAMWSTLAASHVIHNGVDSQAFPAGCGGESLCWAGRLTAEKGADTAVQVAALADRPLRIAGPISDPDWFEAVLRPHLGEQVTYLGALSGPELAELYGTSAATLVTPRWEEPFCLVAAESLMCGTPVAGVRRGGLPEVVSASTGRLVDPGHGLVRRLADTVDHVARLDRRAIAAHARRALSLQTMIGHYESLLTTVSRTRDPARSLITQSI